MTFANIPFVVDGALTSSALLRKALYASIGGDGVLGENDLEVSANSPASQSLLVAPGVGVVLNRYLSNPNEVYVTSNPSVHTVTSGEMPGSSGGTTYWMVCVVVGDPQSGFSQVGHPFMPSDFDEGEANTFQYVRVVVLPCSASDTTFAALGLDYPGLALARLEIPASTTTITSGMITDLRVMINQQSDSQWLAATMATDWDNDAFGAFGWPNVTYRKIGNMVHLRGLAGRINTTSGADSVMFTLPPGYRPAAQERFAATLGIASGVEGVFSVDVYPNGDVKAHGGTNAPTVPAGAWISLSTVKFLVD